jgi:hypothetical protein
MCNVSDEIEPYVVYRLEGAQLECALWQFKDGPKALALFLSGDSATSYIQAANTGTGWKIFRPAKPTLLEILKAGYENGIQHAVLDPDVEKAKRIFYIPDILKVVGE